MDYKLIKHVLLLFLIYMYNDDDYLKKTYLLFRGENAPTSSIISKTDEKT